jgi:hypothetical protein
MPFIWQIPHSVQKLALLQCGQYYFRPDFKNGTVVLTFGCVYLFALTTLLENIYQRDAFLECATANGLIIRLQENNIDLPIPYGSIALKRIQHTSA